MGGPIWYFVGGIGALFILWLVSIPLAHHHLIWWGSPWVLAALLVAVAGYLWWLLLQQGEGL